jgi:hypothetical protein
MKPQDKMKKEIEALEVKILNEDAHIKALAAANETRREILEQKKSILELEQSLEKINP